MLAVYVSRNIIGEKHYSMYCVNRDGNYSIDYI